MFDPNLKTLMALWRGATQAQGATQAPLQRVVEYGQAAAAKASEQAQAAYECALTPECLSDSASP